MTTDPISEKNHRKQEDIVRGQRLRRLRSMAALTISNLAEKTGISRVSLNFWEKASRATLSEKGARRIIQAIQKENIECSFEWLWDGHGNEPRFTKSTENNQLFKQSHHPFTSIEKEIELFRSINKNAVITKIEDAKLYPFFEFNDIVGGTWQPLNTLRTEGYCIVDLNGTLQVRWVKKISDAKNLARLSFSPFNEKKDKSEETVLENIVPIVRVWR